MEDNDSFGVTANEEDSVGFSGYSDFHTIDWQRDLARDRMRHRHIVKKRRKSIWELVKVSRQQQKSLSHRHHPSGTDLIQCGAYLISAFSQFSGSSRCSIGMAVCAASRFSDGMCRWCD